MTFSIHSHQRSTVHISQVRDGLTRCSKQDSALAGAELGSRPGITIPSNTGQDPSWAPPTGFWRVDAKLSQRLGF